MKLFHFDDPGHGLDMMVMADNKTKATQALREYLDLSSEEWREVKEHLEVEKMEVLPAGDRISRALQLNSKEINELIHLLHTFYFNPQNRNRISPLYERLFQKLIRSWRSSLKPV